jgi:hypothetical protein
MTLGFVYDSTVGDLIKKVAEALQAGVLGLPAPSGEVTSMYEGMVGTMRPVILVGILITALLTMLRTSNYDMAYAGFSALPKFIGLGIAFAFLPQFMEILSKMTLDVLRPASQTPWTAAFLRLPTTHRSPAVSRSLLPPKGLSLPAADERPVPHNNRFAASPSRMAPISPTPT